MSISSILKKYSDFIINNSFASSQDDQLNKLLRLIGSMNNYDDLSLWENDVQTLKIGNKRELEKTNLKYKLAMELFNFGRFNLYTKYNFENTLIEYKKLINAFYKHGFNNIKIYNKDDLKKQK